MNILILGCSWGVPNYVEHDVKTWTPDAHIHTMLKDQGHNVINLSLYGSSNLRQVFRFHSWYQGRAITEFDFGEYKLPFCSIDLVIWFKTSVYRDWPENIPKNPTLFKGLVNETYKRIANVLGILDEPKFVAIGGVGPLLPSYTEYFTPDLVIEDWRSDILGIDFPKNHYWGGVGETFALDYKNLSEEEQKEISDVYQIMSESPRNNFPDDCHPGLNPHKNLFQTISNLIKGE